MSPKSEIRLFVIVPVFGNWDETMDCLRALEAQTTRQFDVLIADDGSPELPPPDIHGLSLTTYLRHPHRGFAANCNAAAREAIRRGATHLLFLNNDTAFSARFVEAWLSTIAALPEAILSPNIYRHDEPAKVWYSGGKFTIWAVFFRLRHEWKQLTQVELLCGCALLISAVHWIALEGFDEIYGMYFEDLDLMVRAKRKGLAAFVVPEADLRVWHKVGRSSPGSGRTGQRYRLLCARAMFIRTHFDGMRRFVCLALSYAHLAAVYLVSVARADAPGKKLFEARKIQ